MEYPCKCGGYGVSLPRICWFVVQVYPCWCGECLVEERRLTMVMGIAMPCWARGSTWDPFHVVVLLSCLNEVLRDLLVYVQYLGGFCAGHKFTY